VLLLEYYWCGVGIVVMWCFHLVLYMLIGGDIVVVDALMMTLMI